MCSTHPRPTTRTRLLRHPRCRFRYLPGWPMCHRELRTRLHKHRHRLHQDRIEWPKAFRLLGSTRAGWSRHPTRVDGGVVHSALCRIQDFLTDFIQYNTFSHRISLRTIMYSRYQMPGVKRSFLLIFSIMELHPSRSRLSSIGSSPGQFPRD